MTHVLVTGAHGFIGQALVQRLLRDGLGGCPVARMTCSDLAFSAPPTDSRVHQVCGSIADAHVRAQAMKVAPNVIFHMASVPGGAAERDPDLGRRVNLEATLALIGDCRALPRPPRLIFASSVAVYGDHLPDNMSEDTRPTPALSYGAHKLACEILLSDASRRGWVDACSLRLPGVVARPGDGAGLMSAFMSQIFWSLSRGQPIVLPVSERASCWWMSVGACVDNLLHAATMNACAWSAQRCYQMPVLRLGIADVATALLDRFGGHREALVRHVPDPHIEHLFGRYPALHTPEAERIGLKHDGDVKQLIARALQACN